MKKKISLITFLLLLFATTQSHAQFSFGAKAGLNLANLSITNLPEGYSNKMIPSFNFTGFAAYNVVENFYVELGLGISGKGSELSKTDVNTVGPITVTSVQTIKWTPLYFEIPINALYKVDLGEAKLHLFAGPYFGFGVGGNNKTSSVVTSNSSTVQSTSTSDTEAIVWGSEDTCTFKSMDIGINVGVGVEYSGFMLRVQYGIGLTNINPATAITNMEYKNGVIGVSVGYSYDLSGNKKHKKRRRR